MRRADRAGIKYWKINRFRVAQRRVLISGDCGDGGGGGGEGSVERVRAEKAYGVPS